MIEFFKSEDFHQWYEYWQNEMESGNMHDHLANEANAKLERESQIIYGNFGTNGHNEITHVDLPHTHKALLIGIEEVIRCEHLTENISTSLSYSGVVFTCRCGSTVKPTTFKTI